MTKGLFLLISLDLYCLADAVTPNYQI